MLLKHTKNLHVKAKKYTYSLFVIYLLEKNVKILLNIFFVLICQYHRHFFVIPKKSIAKKLFFEKITNQ